MKKVYLKTYGCQSNVYDSGRILDVLKPLGYMSCDGPEGADLAILNTCHIREKAEEKVFSDLGRLQRHKKRRHADGKQMVVGVAGCVAQGAGGEIIRRAPYVDLVFGPQTYHKLPQMLSQVFRERDTRPIGSKRGVMNLDFPPESKFDFLPEESTPRGPVAFLAIQEGCDKFCTYCVVPYTRGVEFSRPAQQILEEAERLVSNGAREIILLGQNVNAYHGVSPSGQGEWGLGDLIRALANRLESQGLRRIRYTTSHPRDVAPDLLEAHRDVPLLMPFLHLPVQSGSDKILKAMNRKHTRDWYVKCIDQFRHVCPKMVFSSDFIVGFPGETDQDFEDTLQLVRDVNFAQAYSFKYSVRPGTPAGHQKDQVSETVKKERLCILQELLNEQQLDFNQKTIGQTFDLLIERPGQKPDQWIGRSPYMQSVHIIDRTLHPGDFVPVRIEEGLGNSLRGRRP